MLDKNHEPSFDRASLEWQSIELRLWTALSLLRSVSDCTRFQKLLSDGTMGALRECARHLDYAILFAATDADETLLAQYNLEGDNWRRQYRRRLRKMERPVLRAIHAALDATTVSSDWIQNLTRVYYDDPA